ncbi:MAG: hypothetical protein ACRD9Y_24455 [Blastocatellia bacterium]
MQTLVDRFVVLRLLPPWSATGSAIVLDPLYWGMFTKVEPKLQGGVLIGLGVRCAAFNIPNAPTAR